MTAPLDPADLLGISGLLTQGSPRTGDPAGLKWSRESDILS